MQGLKTIGTMTVLFMLSGCAAFTPYESNFTCPKTFNGKCVSTTTAYKESLEGRRKNRSEGGRPDKGSSENEVAEDQATPSDSKKGSPEHTYFNALIDKLTGILKEPKAPVIAPPQVLRILVLPYQGENAVLYMPRYIYLIIDDAHWVLGNQLSENSSGKDETKSGKRSFPLR